MDVRIQVVAIAVSGLLLLVVLELVRRRRLLERYALLWLLSTAILLGLAIWRGLLETLADALGIAYPPNALFAIGFGAVLVLLLHFSIAVSRLADQSKVLAQRLALLEERQRGARGGPEPAPASQAPAAREPGADSHEQGVDSREPAESVLERAGPR